MRLPPVRFKIRLAMLVVALVGLGMGGVTWSLRMSRLASYYAARAQENKSIEIIYRMAAANSLELARVSDELVRYPAVAKVKVVRLNENVTATEALENAGRSVRKAAHYAALSRKYQRATRYPWLTVRTDPPEPE